MLLIDNKQVNVEDFVSEVERISGKSIPLTEIKHNMEFSFNALRKSFDLGLYVSRNMKVPNIAKGADILASFKAWDDGRGGRTVEFRFANRSPYTNPKNPSILVHDPKAIDFPGGVFNFEEREMEKMIYMYCHPRCYDSPFRKENTPYQYSHNNLKAASRRKSAEMGQRQKAFQHATNVDPSEVKVLAIGLGISLMPHADVDEIRAELQDYAMNNPKIYLEKTSSETIKFEGMIQEALDSGRIIKKTMGSINTFDWAKGSKKGKQIMVCSSDPASHLSELKQHMKQNIVEYYSDLAVLNRELIAESTAEEYLQMVKKGANKESFTPYEETVSFEDVKDYNSSKQYLTEAHPQKGSPSPKSASSFLSLIESGEITAENVGEFLPNYIKKS